MTMVAAPTNLLTGSQIITPLLDQSSDATEASLEFPTSKSAVILPSESVVKLIIVPSDSYRNCRFVPTSPTPLTVRYATTSSVAFGKIATNSGVTPIATFLIPGEESVATPVLSTGSYLFNFQSIVKPAGLSIWYHA